MNEYNTLAIGFIDRLPLHNVAPENKFSKQRKYLKKTYQLSTYTYKKYINIKMSRFHKSDKT